MLGGTQCATCSNSPRTIAARICVEDMGKPVIYKGLVVLYLESSFCVCVAISVWELLA